MVTLRSLHPSDPDVTSWRPPGIVPRLLWGDQRSGPFGKVARCLARWPGYLSFGAALNETCCAERKLGWGSVETARVFFGLSAAVVVPWGLGWQLSRPWLMVLFTAVYGGYVIGPYGMESKPWAALGAVVLLASSAALWLHSSSTPGLGFSVTLPPISGTVGMTRRVGVATFGAAAVLSVWAAGGTTVSLGVELLSSDRAAIFFSGLLVAVFGGGTLAKVATGPVRREIDSLPDGTERDAALEFMSGGSNIGVLERGLLFAFLAAGQPEAAALVLAAKSLARVPTSEHGKQASEYFLLGTLASVIASLAMSMAARAAVGLPVL